MKKITALLIATIMCLTMLSGLTIGTASADVVTLDVYFGESTSGIDTSWWGLHIKEKLGIEINQISTGGDANQKIATLMASGDLPDITKFDDKTKVEDAINAKLILSFDDYAKYIPRLFEMGADAMRFYRDNVSAGTGKAYAISTNIGDNSSFSGCNWAPTLRWDLYKELGMPQIDTFMDYLPIIKQMQEMYPKNDDGKAVYGISLWNDWDNFDMFLAMELSNLKGKSGDQLNNRLPYLEHDPITGEISDFLAPDSDYIASLKFYFTANQMGLLDPDSATQKFDDSIAKAREGRVLFSIWPWYAGNFNTGARTNAENPIGFEPVYCGESGLFIDGYVSKVGQSNGITVSSTSEYPEKAFELINWWYTEDAFLTKVNGPEGVTWEMIDGAPTPIDFGYYVRDDQGMRKEINGAKTLVDIIMPGTLGNLEPVARFTDGAKAPYTSWPSYMAYVDQNVTKLDKDWRTTMDARTTVIYGIKNKIAVFIPTSYYMVVPKPVEIDMLAQQVAPVIKSFSWQMAFAKDEAEFNDLLAKMTEQAKGLGYDDIIAWDKEAFAQAEALDLEYNGVHEQLPR